MNDDLKGLMEVRTQTSKIMRGAQSVLGSREALAAKLGVEPHVVAEWIGKSSDAPYEAVNKAVEISVAAAIARNPR